MRGNVNEINTKIFSKGEKIMKWFYNMKISARLLAGFIFVALLAGVVGVIGVVNIKTIEADDTALYKQDTIPLSAVANLSTDFNSIRARLRDIILDKGQDRTKYTDEIKTYSDNFPKEMAIYENTIEDKEERDLFTIINDSYNSYMTLADKLINDAIAGQEDKALLLLRGTEMVALNSAIKTSIEKLTEINTSAAKTKSEGNTTAANSAIFMMIIVLGICVLIAIFLGLLISNSVSKPINKIVTVSNSIAEGDLDVSVDINTKDETGMLANAFKKMAENLNEVMSNINSASEQVASGSRQVSASSMALSQGATEQASSVEELTASVEEISSQTKLNAENAGQANKLAEAAKDNAVQGNNRMQEMLKAMGEINDASGNISKIIKVIDEIAFQTNILALNAAVEAARAGQHGKGFAVVAEEVRNLAARSANAAKETTDMIEGTIKKVEGGTRIANETATALDKIVEGVAKAATLVSDIAIASNEQAVGIAQVTQGLAQVSQVIQTNSATSEESAAASEELSSQAELLKEQVARFKLKRNVSAFKGYKEFSPEVLKMLEDMSEKKKANSGHKEEAYAEVAASKPKIALSDREFGKY